MLGGLVGSAARAAATAGGGQHGGAEGVGVGVQPVCGGGESMRGGPAGVYAFA